MLYFFDNEQFSVGGKVAFAIQVSEEAGHPRVHQPGTHGSR